jgi:hypothetical protein
VAEQPESEQSNTFADWEAFLFSAKSAGIVVSLEDYHVTIACY